MMVTTDYCRPRLYRPKAEIGVAREQIRPYPGGAGMPEARTPHTWRVNLSRPTSELGRERRGSEYSTAMTGTHVQRAGSAGARR
jgi:hypothetical protein